MPKKVDCIIHLAANARVFDLVEKPSLARDNFEMIFNMLNFARKNSIPRFIFSSSREIYGNSNKIKHKEVKVLLSNCESPYSATKIGGEALIQSYQHCYGIDFLIFRLSNIYGMYDDGNRVVPLFIKKSLKDEDLQIYGHDKMLDFTHIDDVVKGIILALRNFDKIKNDVYNLGTGHGISIVHLAKIIRDFTGSTSKVLITKNRTGEVVKYITRIKKAKSHFGFKPQIDVKKGIVMSINWYERYYGSLFN